MAHPSRSIALPLQHWARTAAFGLVIAALPWLGQAHAEIQIGTDINNTDNALIQPQPDQFSGGGRNQSLDNGDILDGSRRADVQIGLLGVDVMNGGRGNDVQIGGPDPGGNNADRAWGGVGNDVFLWQPGDGSDFYNGGIYADAVVFGNFVLDEDSGLPALDPQTGLPAVDVSGNGGFCEVVDRLDPDDADVLDALGLDHLVRFFARGPADTFDPADPNGDNGLRVTLHLVEVEYAVCASREGGAIDVFDLRDTPAPIVAIEDIGSRRLRRRLEQIVF